jgi:hypothetical protein
LMHGAHAYFFSSMITCGDNISSSERGKKTRKSRLSRVQLDPAMMESRFIV